MMDLLMSSEVLAAIATALATVFAGLYVWSVRRLKKFVEETDAKWDDELLEIFTDKVAEKVEKKQKQKEDK